jgi:lipopolysaccharide transport system permease protein
MSSAWLGTAVKLDGDSRTARAEFELRNDSNEIWRGAEGFAVSWQLFDAETGALLVDGPRLHPERYLVPGESARMTLEIPFPAEDGRYRAIISTMVEDVGWDYARGWPFLAVEARVRAGRTELERVRTVKQSTLARERFVRSLGRAMIYPARTVWRNRSLIRVMVRRDVLGRYRGSFGGALWTVINPLLLMLTYFFVFGVVLKSRFGQDQSRTGFALYFLAGMLPWLAFSEAAGRAPTLMLEHRSFVKKLVFAVETLPVNLVASGLVTEAFAIALFAIFLAALRGGVPGTVVWLPALLIPQILFTAGVAWFLAALGVFVRDLGQINGFLLTVWFFLTPICYPETSLGPSAKLLLSKNPIYVLVAGYRAVFLDGRAPAFGPLWKLWLLSAAVCILGHAWFYKLRKSFADIV